MNTSSTIELFTTFVLGTLVMSVLTFNGMASAVAIGSVIAISLMGASHVLSNR